MTFTYIQRMDKSADIIISGAGPAGTACALALAGSGLEVLLLDKAEFPRDKICGDALSVDVLNQLPMLSESLAADFIQLSEKVEIPGIRIVSPGYHEVDLPFLYKGSAMSGYVCRRHEFDHLLLQHACSLDNVQFRPSCKVISASVSTNGIKVLTSKGELEAAMVVAADGAHSPLARQLGNKIQPKHNSAGLRVYYEGVTQMHDSQFIELLFFNDLLPGYLWIFPLPENRANVGLGVLSSRVSLKRLNLKKILDNKINNHPYLKQRFNNASPLESVKGFGLPLGSSRRRISSDRLLLSGDAAGLIDPFSGEGIGNAIRSGRKAAAHIRSVFLKNDFSATFNQQYDKEIYKSMGQEFKVSRSLQKACTYPWLFDWIARKASSSPYWKKYMMDAMGDMHKKNHLTNPALYLKMLIR